MAFKNDIIIPKEILNGLQNSIRIIDKKHLAGYWPVEFKQLRKLQELMPEILGSEALARKYDLAIGYKVKPVRGDLAKSGLQFLEDRVVPGILIRGIPVPWTFLQNAGIDNRRFEVVLTPKGL